MDDSWAIYIDIEGFSAFYTEGNDALWALNRLMLAIYRIGKLVFPEPPDRLFVHQLGDGFLIVSDCHEAILDRAASIATVLMKFITSFGLFARASVAEGDLSDITGCYPKEVMDNCRQGDTLVATMGAGSMIISPVMGTSLINAVGIDKIAPKGPMLTLPISFRKRLSSNIISKAIVDTPIMAIDWIHTEGDHLTKIKTKANLEFPSPKNLEICLGNYMSKHKLPSEWKNSCYKYLDIKHV